MRKPIFKSRTYLPRADFLAMAKEQAVFWQCSVAQAVRTMRRFGLTPHKKG